MSETRALTAALSGPAFHGAASRSALHTSERHAERWAPEGKSSRREGGLRSLAFADRVAGPWMSAAGQSRATQMFSAYANGTGERSVPGVSWLFPRPWFQDELDWMAAAREGLEATPSVYASSGEGFAPSSHAALSTRGTYISGASSASRSTGTSAAAGFAPTAAQAWTQIAMPVLSPDVMSAIAPSMRTSSSPGARGGRTMDVTAPMHHNLRAWSPSVDFAAASAAEVVMGAMSSVEAAGLPALAERSPIWSGLAVVTPSSLGEPASGASRAPSGFDPFVARPQASYGPSPSMASGVSPSMASSVTPSTVMPTTVMPTSSGFAPTSSEQPSYEQSRVEHARESISRIESRLEAMRSAPASSGAPAGSPSVESGAGSTPVAAAGSGVAGAPLSTGEQQLATAARSSAAVAHALRTVELLLGAAAPSRAIDPTGAIAERRAADASTGEPAAFAAPSVSAGVAPSSNFAPSAGPRVAMPVGLGGLVASLEASRTVAQPMSRVRLEDAPFTSIASPMFGPRAAVAGGPAAGAEPGASSPAQTRSSTFSPVWAQSPSALASVSSHGVRAVEHLSWSDRWLARFAGASPLALSAFDAARTASEPALRPLAAGSPEIVYLQPSLSPRAIADAGWQPRPQPLPEPGVRPARPVPTGVFRIDDDAAVSDDVFAAIAAATVAAPPASRAPSQPVVAPRAGLAPASPGVAPFAPGAAPFAPGVAPSVAADSSAPSFAGSSVAGAPRPVMAPVDLLRTAGRTSVADLVSIAVPASPDAGMAAGLASSPMAPALAGILPLPNAPIFDPRALQSAGLSEAYLGGFLARAAMPIGVLSGAPSATSLAAASAPAIGASAGAMASWTRRDLALAPLSMRLASAAPDRELVATGGDVDVVLRGGRGAVGLFPPTAAPTAPFAPAAPSSAGFPGAMPVVAPIDAAAGGPTGPAAARAAVTAPPRELAEAMAAAARGESAVEASMPAELASPAERVAPPAETIARASLETELIALRSALLATPSAASVPLAHAEHAPLVASTTAVPDRARAVLPSLAGIVHGASTPMATLLARGAMEPLAEAAGGTMAPGMSDPTVDAPSIVAHAPTIASAGGRPGGLAEAALAWSINEERAAANLAFDFVSPELLLAAKVYGLPPGAAAQAMRIASAGPSAMSSLATSLDLTFLRAFQSAPSGASRGFEPGARGEIGPFVTAPRPEAAGVPGASFPTVAPAGAVTGPSGAVTAPSGALVAPTAPASIGAVEGPFADAAMAAPRELDAMAAADRRSGADLSSPTPFAATPSSSGRLPRGAFLWPAGSVAAMGLRALSADGHAGLPVVALELLAAQAVAELGTWVTAFPTAGAFPASGAFPAGGAFGPGGAFVPAGAFSPGGAFSPTAAAGLAGDELPAAAARGFTPTFAAPVAGSPGTGAPGAAAADRAADAAAFDAPRAETVVADAAEAAAWFAMPTPARARFESVYIALARSPEGQSLSPSARAARAMSLLARSDDSQRLTTRERAQAAWSMLPAVYGNLDVVAPVGAPARDDASDPEGLASGVLVDTRPGLSGLAARAGDALGSFVTPSAEEISSVGQRGDSAPAAVSSAANRVAPPIYVDNAQRGDSGSSSSSSITTPRAGRTYSQFGGGEAEIPSWFESAARKMFDGGGQSSGAAMNLAQMILVTAMPSKQIAAATRGGQSGGAGSAPTGAGAKQQQAEKPDVDQLALEIFHEVMKLIEIARERSGDPFQ